MLPRLERQREEYLNKQAILSSDHERFLKAYDIHPGDEGHFETYYRYQVNDRLAISPDLQVIHNIARSTESHTVTVFGIRGQIDFQITLISFRMVEIKVQLRSFYQKGVKGRKRRID